MNMRRYKFKTQQPKLVPLEKLKKKGILGNKKYIGEPKFDGIRAILVKRGNKVKILSRYGDDITEHFPTLVEAAKKLKHDITLDGEITVKDEKSKTHFEKIISLLKSKKPKRYPVIYHVFDILSVEGKDIKNKPLIERKKILSRILKKTPRTIRITPFKVAPTVDDYKKFIKEGYEGIVIKKIDSKYKPGKRIMDWIKYKKEQTIDARIVGLKKTPKGKMSFVIKDLKGNPLGLVSSAKLTTEQREMLIEEIEKGKKPRVEVVGTKTIKGKIRHPRIVKIRLDLK